MAEPAFDIDSSPATDVQAEPSWPLGFPASDTRFEHVGNQARLLESISRAVALANLTTCENLASELRPRAWEVPSVNRGRFAAFYSYIIDTQAKNTLDAWVMKAQRAAVIGSMIAQHAPLSTAERIRDKVAENGLGQSAHIYSTEDGAAILDYILEGARVSCFLRPRYAHLMAISSDVDEDLHFQSDTYDETAIINAVTDLIRRCSQPNATVET